MAFERVEIGPCRLIRGDSLSLLDTIECDVVLTDPPYGVELRNGNGNLDARRGGTDRSFSVVGDSDQTVGQFVLDWAERHDLPTITFASPWKPWPGYWRNLIAWDKGGAVGGGGDIRTCLKRSWELIQAARTGFLMDGRNESVVRFAMIGTDTAEHICAKPVELMEWLLQQFVPRGSVVFDPFMGRAASGVACIRRDCRFIGCEIDREHFEGACRRLETAWQLKRSELPFDKPEQMVQSDLFTESSLDAQRATE